MYASPITTIPQLPLLARSRPLIVSGLARADPLNNTSSPYRGKNYKLLLELITTAAVRAYRSELRISGNRYTLNWLEKFLHRNDMKDKLTLKVRESLIPLQNRTPGVRLFVVERLRADTFFWVR